MVVGEVALNVDVAVIGAGPGGYVAALRAADLGKEVALIEDRGLGGVCLNRGCIPSKALIHVAKLAHEIKNAEQLGINVELKSIDMKKVHEWKNSIVEKLTTGIASLCKQKGIEVIKGKAYFESSNRLGITDTEGDIHAIEFKKAVIATGTKPIELKSFPYSNKFVVNSRGALNLEEIPGEFVFIGAGYIGIELGMAFSKLGSKVTIVEGTDKLLHGVDKDIELIVKRKLKELGVEIHFNSKALEMKEQGKKAIIVAESEKGKFELSADKILVGVGRKPHAENLQLQNTKVELDEKGFIKIDSQCRTTDKNIFAIGDITGDPRLAHRAYRQGKVVAEVIAGQNSMFDNKVVPAAVFSDPEIAMVGLNETEAKEKNLDVIVGKFPFAASGRAMTLNDTTGFVKVIADKSGEILGLQAIGSNASNLISEAALAIEMGAFLDDLALTIHPHPTLSEAIMEAAENALGKGVHVANRKH